MKKITSISLILSALITAPYASATDFRSITFQCPASHSNTGDTNVISYYNPDTIIGYGTESFDDGATDTVRFSYTLNPAADNISNDLSSYYNEFVSYDSQNAIVYCHFSNPNQTYTPFAVAYQMLNASGGTVKSSSNNSITILVPQGLQKK